jgi:hypothetical protein
MKEKFSSNGTCRLIDNYNLAKYNSNVRPLAGFLNLVGATEQTLPDTAGMSSWTMRSVATYTVTTPMSICWNSLGRPGEKSVQMGLFKLFGTFCNDTN